VFYFVIVRIEIMNPPEMTLRDYFAGLAMQVIIAQEKEEDLSGPYDFASVFTQVSKASYKIADAMMEARKQ